MPTLSSAGVGSGLDVRGLVSQLVAAERSPVATRLSRQESATRVELSAIGRLQSALAGLADRLSALTDNALLKGRSASSGNDEVFTATAASGAAVGSYDIQVEQLAKAHRLATATPLSPPDSNVGYGSLDLSLGTDSFSVAIDAGAQRLSDIRDAINNAADNPGIAASIINVDGGAVLQLSSSRNGSESQIQIAASGGDGGLGTLVADLATSQTFQDAQIYINGALVTSSSNSITGVIEGVTIELQSALPGQAVSLSVAADHAAAIEAVKAFVAAYNTYRTEAQGLGGFNADTGTAGALNGDAALRGINSQLRNALSGSYGAGGITNMVGLGLSIDVKGELTLDEARFGEALSQDFSGVRSFIEGDTGFAQTLKTIAGNYADSDGLLEGRLERLNERLDRIETRRDALDLRMERVEARYLAQFTALDSMLARLQQTSTYLAQQLASLPGVRDSSGS